MSGSKKSLAHNMLKRFFDETTQLSNYLKLHGENESSEEEMTFAIYHFFVKLENSVVKMEDALESVRYLLPDLQVVETAQARAAVRGPQPLQPEPRAQGLVRCRLLSALTGELLTEINVVPEEPYVYQVPRMKLCHAWGVPNFQLVSQEGARPEIVCPSWMLTPKQGAVDLQVVFLDAPMATLRVFLAHKTPSVNQELLTNTNPWGLATRVFRKFPKSAPMFEIKELARPIVAGEEALALRDLHFHAVHGTIAKKCQRTLLCLRSGKVGKRKLSEFRAGPNDYGLVLMVLSSDTVALRQKAVNDEAYVKIPVSSHVEQVGCSHWLLTELVAFL